MRLGMIVATMTLALLSFRAEAKRSGSTKSLETVRMNASLEPLREHFKEHRGKLRFVTLLSPT